MKKLISLVIPLYNEAENLQPLYNQIHEVWQNAHNLNQDYTYEIIPVNDGSTDDSPTIIEKLVQKDPRVKFIEFSRNFGKEAATSAGLHHASGEAAIMIDADLQHPPELIPKFIQKWQMGAKVVIGTYTHQTKQPLYRRISTSLYYHTMRLIGEENIELNSSDFRLLDRAVINAFKKLPERNRITRGLIDWLGFQRDFVPLAPHPRRRGRSTYDFKRLAGFTISGLLSHSLFPLKLSLFLGLFITLSMALLGAFALLNRYLLHDPLRLDISNLGLLALLITFLVGLVLISLGLTALYIVNIQREVTGRPLYVISKHNLEEV